MTRVGYYSPETAQMILDEVKKWARQGAGPRENPYRYDGYIMKTDGSGCTARSGTTVGSGTATPYYINGSNVLTAVQEGGSDVSLDVYNISTETIAPNSYVQCKLVGEKLVVEVESETRCLWVAGSGIAARSGSTPGSATCTLQTLASGSIVATAITGTVLNLDENNAVASNAYIQTKRIDGKNVVDWEACE